MNGVGLGGFCQDIEHIDVNELIGKVVSLHENAPGIKLQIARETESYRVALDEQYEGSLGYYLVHISKSHKITAAGYASATLS